jgi:outer membrane receptor for ferrienterochelin and colicin
VTPRNVSRWTLAYQHPKGAVSTTLNRVNGYISEPFSARDVQTGQVTTVTGMRTPAFWTLDVHSHYNLTPRITVKAAIANLLNQSAPISISSSQNTSAVFGVNPNLSSVWGRTVSLSVTARF